LTSFHLRLCLSSDAITSRFFISILYAFFISSVRVSLPSYYVFSNPNNV
jgi:hypothetical protein